ncbi:hypothetical protein FKM82_023720 [Ascaphus truei]
MFARRHSGCEAIDPAPDDAISSADSRPALSKRKRHTPRREGRLGDHAGVVQRGLTLQSQEKPATLCLTVSWLQTAKE